MMRNIRKMMILLKELSQWSQITLLIYDAQE